MSKNLPIALHKEQFLSQTKKNKGNGQDNTASIINQAKAVRLIYNGHAPLINDLLWKILCILEL